MADGSSPVPSTPQHARQAAPTSAHPGERLTLREVEAPRQIAAGQTDQAIGDRLVISRRTVTTYVTSILGKLGLSARSAAAAYAVRHGLA